ncbi:MAG: OmpH family outer membrane protein [Clostridium sp.]|nr:OmpH family outer membrane protein [Clostridium sp.]
MKKTALFAYALLLAAGFATSSCDSKQGTAAEPAAVAASTDAATLPNIRYVDGDSIMANYNLAKDIQEFILRTHSKLDNAQQARATEIQRFAAQIEEKGRNNGYLTQDSYNADMQRLQKMQADAENQLGAMQRSAAQEVDAQQRQLNDSIETFIKEYNRTKGYDAILLKTSGLYFNPALDITSEVIEGLNKRYNKVEK